MNTFDKESILTEYVMKNKEKLINLSRKYVISQEAAEDVFQDSFLKAWTSLDLLDYPEYISSWMGRIVINKSIDYIRKNSKYQSVVDIDTLTGRALISDFNVKPIESKLDLAVALKSLTLEEQDIVHRKFIQGFELKDIARVLNKKESYIKSKCYKSLKKIQKII